MLLGRVPGGLRARLTAATLVLEQYGPPVAEATRSLGRLSAELDVALRWPASLDPAELEPITDDEQAAVWRQLDWWEPWRIADELRDSHPDALTVEPERRSS